MIDREAERREKLLEEIVGPSDSQATEDERRLHKIKIDERRLAEARQLGHLKSAQVAELLRRRGERRRQIEADGFELEEAQEPFGCELEEPQDANGPGFEEFPETKSLELEEFQEANGFEFDEPPEQCDSWL